MPLLAGGQRVYQLRLESTHHVLTRTLSTSTSVGSHVGTAIRGSESRKLVERPVSGGFLEVAR